jgi:serine acetyltransferase
MRRGEVPGIAALPECSLSLSTLFRADCAAAGYPIRPGRSGWSDLVRATARSRSVRVVLLARLMQKAPAWQAQIWRRLMLSHGCDVARRTVIGPGLRLPRAYGIVIGANSVLGESVTIHQHVSMSPAARDWRRPPGLARLGDRVEVWPGAVILGDLEIGAGATVGPLSVLTHSLEEGARFCNAARAEPRALEARTAGHGDGASRPALLSTIVNGEIRPDVQLGSRVTIASPSGAAPVVIGEGASIGPGAVLLGPVAVPPATSVPANHLVEAADGKFR